MTTKIHNILRTMITPVLWSCLLPQLVQAQAPETLEPLAQTPAEQAGRATPDAPDAREGAAAEPSPHNQAVANVIVNTAEPPSRSFELAEPPPERPRPRILHGFRLGYMHWMNFDKKPPADPDADAFQDQPQSPKDALDLASPHMFVLGYEVAQRLSAGSEALNVLLVGNAMLAGLEQSRFLPTANALIGFELQQSLQLAVGANIAPVGLDDKFAHMIIAAGWTPRSGDLYLPVHVFFIPDVDGYHRMGLTFGVTWERGGL